VVLGGHRVTCEQLSRGPCKASAMFVLSRHGPRLCYASLFCAGKFELDGKSLPPSPFSNSGYGTPPPRPLMSLT